MSETKRRIDRLVLVYAADGGHFNALVDSAKKMLRLNGCSLCTITHGLSGEKDQWRECKDEFGVPVESYHRDEIPPELAATLAGRLPAVLAESEGEQIVLLGPDVLNRMDGQIADFRGRLLTHAAMKGLVLPRKSAA